MAEHQDHHDEMKNLSRANRNLLQGEGVSGITRNEATAGEQGRSVARKRSFDQVD